MDIELKWENGHQDLDEDREIYLFERNRGKGWPELLLYVLEMPVKFSINGTDMLEGVGGAGYPDAHAVPLISFAGSLAQAVRIATAHPRHEVELDIAEDAPRLTLTTDGFGMAVLRNSDSRDMVPVPLAELEVAVSHFEEAVQGLIAQNIPELFDDPVVGGWVSGDVLPLPLTSIRRIGDTVRDDREFNAWSNR